MSDVEFQKDLALLSLSYERQVSRAHTIFSAFWEIFNLLTIGSIGVILSLKQTGIFDFNRFTFIISSIIVLFTAAIFGIIAYYYIFQSQMDRKIIVEKIKGLRIDKA